MKWEMRTRRDGKQKGTRNKKKWKGHNRTKERKKLGRLWQKEEDNKEMNHDSPVNCGKRNKYFSNILRHLSSCFFFGASWLFSSGFEAT